MMSTEHRYALAMRDQALRGVPGAIMVLYVVYNHPLDFPRHYVVRPQVAFTDGRILTARLAGLYDDEDEAHAECEALGLTYLTRAAADEPHIIGTWL
jgi:hypothetical protein